MRYAPLSIFWNKNHNKTYCCFWTTRSFLKNYQFQSRCVRLRDALCCLFANWMHAKQISLNYTSLKAKFNCFAASHPQNNCSTSIWFLSFQKLFVLKQKFGFEDSKFCVLCCIRAKLRSAKGLNLAGFWTDAEEIETEFKLVYCQLVVEIHLSFFEDMPNAVCDC